MRFDWDVIVLSSSSYCVFNAKGVLNNLLTEETTASWVSWLMAASCLAAADTSLVWNSETFPLVSILNASCVHLQLFSHVVEHCPDTSNTH